MEKELFIGVDFSKKTFDASVIHRDDLNKVNHRQFENTKEGCVHLFKWVRQQTNPKAELWMFCGAHTGLYSLLLSEFLTKKGMFLWLENPLQIRAC